MKRIVIIIVLALCLILIGCNEQREYDFSDENIIAYYGDLMIYTQEVDMYIDFETKIRKQVVELSDKNNLYESNYVIIDEIELLDSYYQYLNRSYEYVDYSYEQKEIDYYKLLIRYDELGAEYTDYIEQQAEIAVTRILEEPVVSNDLWFVELDICSAISEISEEYNISFQECAETVYRKLYVNSIILSLGNPDFIRDKYQGEKKEVPNLNIKSDDDLIEYNGLMKEYYYYAIDVQKQYDEYLEKKVDTEFITRENN